MTIQFYLNNYMEIAAGSLKFIPINLKNHFILFSVKRIERLEFKLTVYDSYYDDAIGQSPYKGRHTEIVTHLISFFERVANTLGQLKPKWVTASSDISSYAIDKWDCGPMVCLYAKWITRNTPRDITTIISQVKNCRMLEN